MTRPLVKVIIPCYGYAHWLPGCVSSALEQPGVDVRVLIVDDCSADDTPTIAATLAARDKGVSYHRNAVNLGLIGSVNHGLAWADDGDYTVVLSADDLLVKGSLGRATSVMEAAPRIGLVYGRARYMREGRRPPSTRGRWIGTTVWSGRDWLRIRCRAGYNCISSPEVVVRTSVHRAAGRYDDRCFHTCDMNMWLRIAARCDIAYINGVPQALYRVHAASMLRSDHDPLVDLRDRWAAFESMFASCSELLPDASELRSLAGRRLAREALWLACRAVDRGSVDEAATARIDELVSFARAASPQTAALREWRGLQLRRRIGAGRTQWFVPFLVSGAAHRARVQYTRARWIATGV